MSILYFSLIFVICLYIMISYCGVFMGFLCVPMCISMHLYMFFVLFSLALCFSACLFILSCTGLFGFILFIIIMFIINIVTCLFSDKRKQERIWIWVGGWVGERESGKSWGRGNHNQNILFEKNLFSVKNKIKWKLNKI